MENEIKRRKSVSNLSISRLHHHPNNPRKNIGDITELTESIKKNGIMQNLTVIPGYYKDGEFIESDTEYTIIIGHRRYEAAKAAGLYEVPCRIYENLPECEQIATMLEENMQRNDLTLFEQADSFQMCLDLGETVDTLSEKTGFAKSTIYHRLNIAKLDKDIITKKEESGAYQLTIADYAELEKVKSIEERNKILESAYSTNDLRFKCEQSAKNEKKKVLLDDAKEILRERGIEEGQAEYRWNGRYEVIYRHNVSELDITNAFIIPPEASEKIIGESVYLINAYSGEITILNPKTKEEEKEDKEVNTEKSAYEIRHEREQKYKDIRNPLDHKTHDFIMDIIVGKLEDIEKSEILSYCDVILNYLLSYDLDTNFLDWESMIDYMCGIERWEFETEEEFVEKVREAESYPLHHKLLIALGATLKELKTLNYDGSYSLDRGKVIMEGYNILERWDWTYTDDERLLLNGNHDIYEQEEEE